MNQTIPFRTFGTMLDCSRNAVPNLDSLKKWIDLTASLGYNLLLLYTEETYEVDGEPYFGYMRGRFTKAELREADAYARERNMTLMPCIQVLAHMLALKRWREYGAHFDTEDILLVEDERVYTLISHIFETLADTFTCRTIHIGMDEANMLGRGRYFDQHGDCNRTELMLKHLRRVCQIGEKYGFQFQMWSDMFFRMVAGEYYVPDAQFDDQTRAMIPENVTLVYWDYYSTEKSRYDAMLDAHARLTDKICFAGGLWTWTGVAPHNGFSMNITKCALESCREHGIRDVFLTMWGDNGGECSRFAVIPSLFYASQIARGETDEAVIRERFAARFGLSFDDFMQLDLPGTKNGRADTHCNADKYLFYSDPFMGMMDKTVEPGEGAQFALCAERLKRLSDVPQWGYLFQTLGALCDVLADKAELGLRTHEAYLAGDKAALRELTEVYAQVQSRMEAFLEIYRAQWLRENKPHGFDVQEIRIGGAIQRLKGCRKRLLSYLDGETDRLEELEEMQLDFFGGDSRSTAPCFTVWSQIATANVV